MWLIVEIKISSYSILVYIYVSFQVSFFYILLWHYNYTCLEIQMLSFNVFPLSSIVLSWHDREATNCSCFLDNRNITSSSFWWCTIYKELWKMMFICWDACGDHKGGRIVENVGSCHSSLFIKSAKVMRCLLQLCNSYLRNAYVSFFYANIVCKVALLSIIKLALLIRNLHLL